MGQGHRCYTAHTVLHCGEGGERREGEARFLEQDRGREFGRDEPECISTGVAKDRGEERECQEMGQRRRSRVLGVAGMMMRTTLETMKEYRQTELGTVGGGEGGRGGGEEERAAKRSEECE